MRFKNIFLIYVESSLINDVLPESKIRKLKIFATILDSILKQL